MAPGLYEGLAGEYEGLTGEYAGLAGEYEGLGEDAAEPEEYIVPRTTRTALVFARFLLCYTVMVHIVGRIYLPMGQCARLDHGARARAGAAAARSALRAARRWGAGIVSVRPNNHGQFERARKSMETHHGISH